MAALPPHALEVTPETELKFTLSRSQDAASRCTMTLHHPGTTDEHLAFKVKTTQPRRYLVRPNQGLVAPNSTESVNILLVDKDKQTLLQSYDRLGQSALDNSKDKFLVQSCSVSDEFAKKYGSQQKKMSSTRGDSANSLQKELADALTSMWNAISSGGSTPIYNKKLHVQHVAEPAGLNPAAVSTSKDVVAPAGPNLAAIESMSPEQMFQELSSLRRKYDELVNFSVNLTAERDILNNTLEQTKRDLNREMQARATADNSMGGATMRSAGTGASKGSSGMSTTFMLILVLLFSAIAFLLGVKMTKGDESFMEDVPVVGPLLGEAASEQVAAVSEEL